jgi:hypothetical protein
MKRIVVLFHKYQRHRPRLLIHALSDRWRKRGLNVSYVYGTGARPEADLLIPQIDLTRTPQEYIDYCNAYANVINKDVIDISKRRISSHLIQEEDDYRGPVIVKTDCNAGGIPEFSLNRVQRRLYLRAVHNILPVAERAFGHGMAWRKTLVPYRIYNSLAEVPGSIFKNRALVVERFLPEKVGEKYFMRHYLCMGDRVRSIRVSGNAPLLKRAHCLAVHDGLPVPDEIISMRRQLGLDYGKIDYTVHEGQVVIIDVNRTPGPPGTPAATERTVSDLADGIWSHL